MGEGLAPSVCLLASSGRLFHGCMCGPLTTQLLGARSAISLLNYASKESQQFVAYRSSEIWGVGRRMSPLLLRPS